MERDRIGIIIPAYNEAGTIGSAVSSVAEFGIPIVVDDGSNDQTAEFARVAGAIVVCHDKNLGYDGALNSGFAAADSRDLSCVITFDADGQHDALLLKTFINALEKYDVVVGIRPKPARLAEWLFSLYSRLKYKIIDPLCGMKGYRIDVYRAQGFFDSYKSIGTQLMFFAIFNGYSVCQVPVRIHERNDTPRFGDRLKANKKIIRAMLVGPMIHNYKKL